MHKGIIPVVAMLAAAAVMAQADDIYTWTDSKGTVHISQTPQKGARKIVPPEEENSAAKRESSNPVICLGELNETKYYLDRGSVRPFANDRNKYMFNLYVDDKMYQCTAWAYPSGIVGLKPQVGLPDMVARSLRLALIGK